jgi:hypothetical protein
MWLDVALRLAYPGTTVAGFYYRDDGKPAPGNVFKLHGDVWVREQAGFPALMEDAAAGDAVIMEYDNGATRILRKVPPFLCAEDCAVNEYHPETRIIHAAPSPLAVNRYHPL